MIDAEAIDLIARVRGDAAIGYGDAKFILALCTELECRVSSSAPAAICPTCDPPPRD